ncbi:MAG: hypothetical protein ACE5G5_13405 [Candidatus Methylomirabilales bacterium]
MSQPKALLAIPLFLGAVLLGALGTAAQTVEPQALWSAIAQPAFDPDKVAVVENFELRRDAALLNLNGLMAFGRPDLPASAPAAERRIFAASFRGSGRLRFAPTLPLEKRQLAFHSGQELLEAEFTEAVFVFTDNTYEELALELTFQPTEPGELQVLYQERRNRWARYGVNWEPRVLKALLAAEPDRHALFVAELNTREHGWVTLIVDAADPEELELQKLEPGHRALDVWSKFPAGGRRPQEVFVDPVAHHEYALKSYSLDVTVEKNTELKAVAEVNLLMRRAGERVLLLSLDPTSALPRSPVQRKSLLPSSNRMTPKTASS